MNKDNQISMEDSAPEPESVTHGCDHDPQEPHTCPYESEINERQTLCTCCKACTENCADEI